MPGTNPLRCSHSVMVQEGLGSGTVLLLDTGNYPGESNYLNETVTWNGSNWTVVSTSQVDPLGPLPVRSQHGMGYDSTGSHVVLFGGQGGSETAGVFDDTWTCSGSAWTKQTPGTVPFGRYRHSIAALEGVGALMFGGSNVLNILEETWLWSGTNWTLLTPGVVPPARMDFMMAGATGATNVLMFGGKGTATNFGDTWMWVGGAGGDWVLQTPAVSPPSMSEACMAFDGTDFVMFGGRSDDTLIGPQTWVWSGGNGGNWHLATPAVTPAARVGAQMAFDGTRVIMFGGYDQAGNLFGDTWGWSGGTNGNWSQL